MHLASTPGPWEHLRLLAHGLKNEALIDMLRKHGPGSRVLEVSCGTGLLACVAARLGAKEVFAVEDTPLAQEALRLVRENGLEHCIEVIPGRVTDVAPREVDIAFTELVSADPFSSGLLESMDAARRWLDPQGIIVPRRIRIHVGLVRLAPPERRARRALEHVRRIGAQFDLTVGAIESIYRTAGPHRIVGLPEAPLSETVLAFDVPLGEGERPEPKRVEVVVQQSGLAGGAVAWYEAELDDELLLENAPGSGSRWGQLLCAWPEPLPVQAGQQLGLKVRLIDGHLSIEPED